MSKVGKKITVPIQVNLPDDWIEQIVNRLRNDPESEWVEIVRCKDCKHYTEPNIECCELYGAMILWSKDDFCSRGERRTDETD